MKAAFIYETGPPENIHYGDLPVPEPGPGQILVRVRAASVNPIDTYVRSGMVQTVLPKPFIVGSDLAGVVEKCGPGATRFQPGDRVWAANQGILGRQGTAAEYAVVDEEWAHATPPAVRDVDAAALGVVGITAHLGLVRRAALQPGETILVQGGSGGVGSAVVQMAKILGARVLATAGSEEKVKICRELGADDVVNYRAGDLRRQVQQLAPQGVNVWWETRRVPDFDLVVECLAPRGRMVLMAGREARPPFPVGPFYVKGCTLVGFTVFNFSAAEQRNCGDDINRWHAAGRLKARIDRVLPLAEAAAAHRLQEESTVHGSGALAGKIVLEPVPARS